MADLKDVNIVLIDDEKNLIELIDLYLTKMGAKVSLFNDADSGVAYVDENAADIDLVITDNNMPGTLQGEDVYLYIKSRFSDIACLILTGGAKDWKCGVNTSHVIQKPMRFEQLKSDILDVLGAKVTA